MVVKKHSLKTQSFLWSFANENPAVGTYGCPIFLPAGSIPVISTINVTTAIDSGTSTATITLGWVAALTALWVGPIGLPLAAAVLNIFPTAPTIVPAGGVQVLFDIGTEALISGVFTYTVTYLEFA